jgi:hypothetical protein
MIYGLFQYYKDELNSWIRTLNFHKEELRESVSQLGVLSDLQIISSANGKASNSFLDQLMVQESNFDYIGNLIASQQNRLDQAIAHLRSSDDDGLSAQQDLLRAKMQNAERQFVRTKYTCSIFLSTFLTEKQSASARAYVTH